MSEAEEWIGWVDLDDTAARIRDLRFSPLEPEMERLASLALESIEQRSGESIDDWAANLAADVADLAD